MVLFIKMLFKEVLIITFGSVEEMLCSDHLKQPFVHLFSLVVLLFIMLYELILSFLRV